MSSFCIREANKNDIETLLKLEESFGEEKYSRDMILDSFDNSYYYNYVIEINNLNDFKLLDIGCSDGLMIKALTENCTGGKYVGIDISEPMLSKAKNLFENEINDGTVYI